MIHAIFSILPFLVCGFWTLLLLLDLFEHGDRGAHRSLLAWSAASTVLYVGHGVFFNNDRDLIPLTDSLYVATNLAVFPLYLRYLSQLTEGRVSRWILLLAFVPSLLFGGSVGILYIAMDEMQTQQFIEVYLYSNSFQSLAGIALLQAQLHHVAKVLFAVGVVITVWLGTKKIRRYNQLIDSVYADTDDKRLRYVSTLLVLMLCMSVLGFVANVIGRHVFVKSDALLAIPFVLFSVFLFALGYVGFKQHFSFVDIDRESADATFQSLDAPLATTETPAQMSMSPKSGSEPNGKQLALLAQQIDRLMENDHLFLTPNLKVSDLARRLGSNVKYVQCALRRESGVSFSEYINRRRIDYAVLLIEHEGVTDYNELSLRAGFSSVSTFYRNFKLYKGDTPMGYA